MRLLALFLVMIFAFPVVGAQEMTVEASATIEQTNFIGLDEVFLSPDLDEPASYTRGYAAWHWWTWSDETGSDWPDDDANYRLRQYDQNQPHQNQTHTVSHSLLSGNAINVEGTVEVRSDGANLRWIALDLKISPQTNLSNQTIAYIVLQEDHAVDHHRRTTTHLVRELRPEVGFALNEGNETTATFQLPADHLLAAGIDLLNKSEGWTYAIAIFGQSLEGEEDPGLLYYTQGPLPSSRTLEPTSQRWLTVALLAVGCTVLGTVLTNVRRREHSMPLVTASWNEDDLKVTVVAGKANLTVKDWTVREPWKFRRRPPNIELQPGQTRTVRATFVRMLEEDCHVDLALDIEEMGAWQHHVWLHPASTSTLGSVEIVEERP